MTREEFFIEACLRAMQGLLAASGEYSEFVNDPPAHLAVAAHQYATALTQQIYGDPIEWPSELY